MSRTEVVRLDFVENVLETNDHRVLPIAQLFDSLGRQTQDHRNAVLCVAGTHGNWLGVKLRKFSPSSLQ